MAVSSQTKRRLGKLRISPALFVALFIQGEHQGYEIVKNGLPTDAKFVNIGFDLDGNIAVLLESEEFRQVSYGKKVPDLPIPEIRIVNKNGY